MNPQSESTTGTGARRSGAAVLLAAALLALGACAQMAAGDTPALDARFGEAVREARARQTLDPEAGRNTDPVAGLDGQAGREAIEGYQRSFKEPPRTFDILGIGGAGVTGTH